MIILIIHGAMILFAVIMALIGYKIGALKKLFSMFAYIFAAVAMVFLSPKTEQILLENTSVRESVEDFIYEKLMSAEIDYTKILGDALKNVDFSENETGSSEGISEGTTLPEGFELPEGTDLPEGFELPGELELPEGISDALNQNLEDIQAGIKERFETVKSEWVRRASRELSFGVLRVLSHVITLLLTTVFLLLVFTFVRTLTKLPGVNKVNAFFGLLIGLFEVFLFIEVVFCLLFIFVATQSDASIPVQYIRNEILIDPVLNFWYRYNVLRLLIVRVLG